MTAPAKAAVEAVKSVASGDVKGAVANSVGAYTGTQLPVAADNLTNGALSGAAGNIPILGGSLSSQLSSGAGLAMGDTSQLGTYAKTTAINSAAVVGGGYLGSALGVGGTQGILGTSALLQGKAGAAASAFGFSPSDLIPESLKPYANQLGGIVNSFLGSGSTTGTPTEYSSTPGEYASPDNVGAVVLIGGVVGGLALIYVLKKRRKKHG